jgi:hypothetical protein
MRLTSLISSAEQYLQQPLYCNLVHNIIIKSG